ncbi:Hsp20/alpha crystallin family protein [Salarchaeum sp. JOR-1]|uniref:Hsp20/alpha crystallin family protein n=1 Tax=Salarchaeum sp. JOR-1 TaxID=2599399 RepID=UPI001198321C|nr:Hsp20/alpha crystallin family protein [Salarchaeum sp. JOR-1]QDX40644.1 Hsp20/alpha crystallin family protein [Salarchaeum sp. JOR-1]
MTGFRDALRELPDAVSVDLHESEDAYRIVIDVPGATVDTTDVRVEDGVLRVEARREKDAPAGFSYHREDRALFLDVELPLPPDATDGDAAASLDDGVLTVTLPKAGRGRKIEIEG